MAHIGEMRNTNKILSWNLESGYIENPYLSEIYIMSIIESIPGSSLVCNRYWGWGLFPRGVKWTGHEPDHSHPSSAKAKNDGAISHLPHTSSWRGA
jgi:hypothetical protein